jgi:hypothetical protein
MTTRGKHGLKNKLMRTICVARMIMQQSRMFSTACARPFGVIALLAVSFLLVGCQHRPQLSTDDPWNGVLSVNGRRWPVETIGRGARILKWSRWQPVFPDLYVIEMHDGEATGIHHTIAHSLAVVDTKSTNEVVLLQTEIFSSITRPAEGTEEIETWTHETPYRLIKDETGGPCVVLGNPPERIIPLRLSHEQRGTK